MWTVRKVSGNHVVFLAEVSSTLFHLELLHDCENSPVSVHLVGSAERVVNVTVRPLPPGLFCFPVFKLATFMLLYYTFASNCLESYIKQKRNFFGNMHSKIYRE